MSGIELLVLAVGLAMDATAVAAARGLAARRVRARDAALVAVLFGGSQALMPALGALGGAVVTARLAGWGRWLVVGVFVVLGAKMLKDARGNDAPDEAPEEAPFAVKLLGPLAIATSIDALAAGVTLAIRRVSILGATALIGAVTAALAAAAVLGAHHLGARFGRRVQLAGGAILLALALKAALEALRFS